MSNPFEDAYAEKCRQLDGARALIEVLQHDVAEARSRADQAVRSYEELAKTLHCSATQAFIRPEGRPCITVVTTLRDDRGMESVATLIDESMLLTATKPPTIMGRELGQHLEAVMRRYFDRRQA